jgi:hypothetical protein
LSSVGLTELEVGVFHEDWLGVFQED